MFSTLKRRVKKIMKKVEEVVETKEMVKNKLADAAINGCKKLYSDLTKNKNKVGIAVGLLASVLYECIENRIH